MDSHYFRENQKLISLESSKWVFFMKNKTDSPVKCLNFSSNRLFLESTRAASTRPNETIFFASEFSWTEISKRI